MLRRSYCQQIITGNETCTCVILLHMIRTSVLLPDNLHQRLLFASKRSKKPISTIVRETLDEALVTDENAHIEHMYQTLQKLEELGERGVTDASTTINETLYGEHGAWKGPDE